MPDYEGLGRWPYAVRRIVWLRDDAGRGGFRDAMRRGGIEVVELDAGALSA